MALSLLKLLAVICLTEKLYTVVPVDFGVEMMAYYGQNKAENVTFIVYENQSQDGSWPCTLTRSNQGLGQRRVAGDYCEWDLCGSEQYCCGNNLCCDYVYSLWYFWVGVVFLVLLLSACGGLFRYYYRRWSSEGNGPPYSPFPSSPAYTSLPTHISNQDPHFQITEDAVKPKL